jgi:hypothetical protein
LVQIDLHFPRQVVSDSNATLTKRSPAPLNELYARGGKRRTVALLPFSRRVDGLFAASSHHAVGKPQAKDSSPRTGAVSAGHFYFTLKHQQTTSFHPGVNLGSRGLFRVQQRLKTALTVCGYA